MLKKCMFVLLAATVCFSVATAQNAVDTKPAETQPAAPKIPSKPVTTVIPADCAGFIAAENLEKFMDNLLEFVSATDFGDMIQGAVPTGLMPMLTSQLGLGEGFDPQGGFAMVVVNLEKFGFDPDKAELGNITEMPFVLLIAGKNVQEVFASSVIDEETQSFELPRLGKVFFKQAGDYVAMSTNKKALDVFGDAAPSIDKVMTAAQKKLMAANDMTFFINYKTVMPYLIKAASDRAVKMDDKQRKEILESAKQSEQIAGIAMGLDLSKDGMVFTISMEYKEGSEFAKMSAAAAQKGPVKLNRLPSGKYFMALSTIGLERAIPGENNQLVSTIMNVLGNKGPGFSDDLQAKVKKILTTAEEQIKDMQIYIGRNDKGSLAISACIDCNNADKLLSIVPEKAELFREVLRTMAVKGDMKSVTQTAGKVAEKAGKKIDTDRLVAIEKIKGVQITVVPEVAIVEGVKLDAMVLDISKCEISEDARKNVLEIFGDEQIRALYGKVSENQVVVTFGGGIDFAADAIKAARTGGKLEQAPEIAAAMKALPKNTNTVMLVNLKNIFDAVTEMQAKFKAKPATNPATTAPADAAAEEDEENIPGVDDFTFEALTPIVISDYCEGNVENIRIDVPMPVFNDFIRWFMVEMTKAAMEGKSTNLPFPMPGM